MRRLLLPACVFALVFSAFGASSPAASSSPRARAVHEAQRLLDGYVPPRGAVRVTAVPKGDHLLGGGAGGIFGQRVVRHRLWLVHLPTKSFVRYFFHRLSRWHAISYSSDHLRGKAVRSTSVTYAKVGFGGRATGRVLDVVAVKSHRAGWSLLRAQVILLWRLSAAEREDIPAGVRDIEIRGPGGGVSVRDRSQLRTIVRWFDHFQISEAPFGAMSCGVGGQRPSLTFTFRARNVELAKAIVPEHSAACSSATYTIRGKPQNPLFAGEVDHLVQELLGVKLLR